MFEFMRNIFASEQPILEKYNIVDPSAVGNKVRPITVAMTLPTEEATSTSVSLFWSDSENKVYEKTFESQEEAQNIFASLKSDLQEAAELTKDEKLDAAEGLVKELMSRYDVHTDKLVDGNPTPATTTLATKKGTRVKYLGGGSQEGELLGTPNDSGWVKVMWDDGDITDEDFYDNLQVIASKKKAKVVMQNIFFDTPEEAAAFQEKFKKKEPGIGDKPPMAGDFEDDLPLGDDKEDLGLGDDDEGDIGPPSLSHKDFEKDKAKEQKSLTKRIEKEVKDQVKSNLDQKIASNFGDKEDKLLDAMRDMGRTWEEIREYFVKGLKYDEDSVVYYLDQRKTKESPELVDDKPEAPKPPENLVTPETHEELIDEMLEDKPTSPKVDEVEEIEKKDIPMRDKEIANSLTTEIEKKAEEPLETIPRTPSETGDGTFNPTEFKDTADEMEDNPNDPEEIGDSPQEDFQEDFHPGEIVYVMGDYETGTKGYEGEFVSEYTSEGEDYAVIDIGSNEMTEVLKRFVKKASYRETLKKKAAAKCTKCEQDLHGAEYMVCRDCKEKVKKENVANLAKQVKAGVAKELTSRALNLIKADIEELNDSIEKEADPIPPETPTPTKKPVMQPATEPGQTTKDVPVEHKRWKIHPKDTKTKDIELGDSKVQQAYSKMLSLEQSTNKIKANINKLLRKTAEDIKKLRENSKEFKQLKQLQSAVESMAKMVQATENNVIRVGGVVLTFIEETHEKKPKMTNKEQVDYLIANIAEAEQMLQEAEEKSDKAVKISTTKELIESPYRESSLEDKEAGIQDILSELWDDLKAVYDVTSEMAKSLDGVQASKKAKVERKARELELWNPGKNYMGEEYVDYYMGPTRTRDSESLEESNFDVALKQLGGENDGVIVQRAGHWGVGWVEVILVHKDAKEKVEILQNIMNQIEEYPVLDEDDYGERESADVEEQIDSWAFDEALGILGLTDDGTLLEEQTYAIKSAIRDAFSDHGADHLDKDTFKKYYEYPGE